MHIFARRLLVIALSGLVGAVALGLLATDAATLIFGTAVLGMGMVLAILFYLLSPIPRPPLPPDSPQSAQPSIPLSHTPIIKPLN